MSGSSLCCTGTARIPALVGGRLSPNSDVELEKNSGTTACHRFRTRPPRLGCSLKYSLHRASQQVLSATTAVAADAPAAPAQQQQEQQAQCQPATPPALSKFFGVFGVLAVAAVAVLAQPGAAVAAVEPLAEAAAATAVVNGADTAWVLTSTALVLFMTIPGLSLFYGGLVRQKNVLSMLVQCLATTALVTVLWTSVGYSLAFCSSGMAAGTVGLNAFVGGLDKAFCAGLSASSVFNTIPEVLFFCFQVGQQ